MALVGLDTLGLSQHAAFCPPPLQIQKKSHRATFRKRIFRKSIHHRHNGQYVYGPLDDIIDEIRSNIWESPHDYSTETSVLSWAAPLEVPSTWTVAPLPLSRLPSNQPLTIRKNRESRSSVSGSNMDDRMYSSRSSSQDGVFDSSPARAPASTAPWPLFDDPSSYKMTHAPETSSATGGSSHAGAQKAPDDDIRIAEARTVPTKRRPSVLRIFTGLSRLRRTNTSETSGSSGGASDLASPTAREDHNEDYIREQVWQEPSDDAIEAYVSKNARK